MHQPHFNCSGFRHRPCLVDHIGDPKSIPSRCNESVWIITLLGPLKKLQYMCLYWSRLLYCCIFSVLFFLTARATKGFGGTSLYLHFTERKVSIELSLSLTICLYNSTYIYICKYECTHMHYWCNLCDVVEGQISFQISWSHPGLPVALRWSGQAEGRAIFLNPRTLFGDHHPNICPIWFKHVQKQHAVQLCSTNIPS